MPHFGLMNEQALGPVEGPLQRARLHIRGGKRRLRQGKISAGIVTLYDALVSGMQGYIASPEHKCRIHIRAGENINDDRTLYAVLTRAGVFDGSFDFEAFDALTAQALQRDLPDRNYHDLVQAVDELMTQLGIMPFDESQLPPEDPNTF